VSNTWLALAAPTVLHENGVAFAINGKFYLAGGFGLAPAGTTLESFDPAVGWVQMQSMPNPRYAATGAVINGRMYLTGGVNPNGGYASTLDVYDPATTSWRSATGLPVNAQYPMGAAGGGQLFVVGGIGSTALTTTQAYTP
jgi:N-acetylneuraminic acid mutarotase